MTGARRDQGPTRRPWTLAVLSPLAVVFVWQANARLWAQDLWPSALAGTAAGLVGVGLVALPWAVWRWLDAYEPPPGRVRGWCYTWLGWVPRFVVLYGPFFYGFVLDRWGDAIAMARH